MIAYDAMRLSGGEQTGQIARLYREREAGEAAEEGGQGEAVNLELLHFTAWF